jgi:hypothetical protein
LDRQGFCEECIKLSHREPTKGGTMSMPERWPTHRIAMYGAFAGAAYAAVAAWGRWPLSPEWAARSFGGLLGGAAGGAVLAAAVSGIRNLFVR